MLHLHRGERMDVLVDALADLLAEAPTDPLAPDVVAVPTRGVERWVAQRLSHRLGCDPLDGDGVCANVQLPSPGDLLHRVMVDVAQPGLREWEPGRLRWSLLATLDAARGVPVLSPLLDVVGAAADGRELRLLAASRLAAAFDRYAAERPQMLVDWGAGDDTDGAGSALDDDLRWQAELFRRVRARLGTPGPAECLDDVCAAIRADPSAVDLPQRLSVLGPTRLTTLQVRLLAALSVGREVHLWLAHASPGAWERLRPATRDAPAPLPRRRLEPSADQLELPLLAALGRDSLELQQRLRRLDVPAGDEHHPLAERPDTLLGALQRALRDDSAPAPVTGADSTVQVHACHGPSRQVEVLREVVVGLLADDPSLEPRDVVVMVPDIEHYAPLLSATFGLVEPGTEDPPAGPPRHPGQRLRVSLADRGLRQTNPVVAVAADLVDLVDGRLPAGQVLDLASSAPVRRRFELTDDDLERLRAWLGAAGVRWGLDAAHRSRAGLPGVVENTWRAGLDRLLLGVTTSEDGLPTTAGVLPFDDVGSADIGLVGRLADYLDRLARATDVLSGEQPLADWVVALLAAVESITAVPAADAWQPMALTRTLGDLVVEAGEYAASLPLGLGDLRALLADAVAGRPTRAGFRTGDLTVCSLAPMRSVPHRVVCILGLDDGVFPRSGALDGDDALARDPVVGERDVRSEDRQILLDALHAATDTLVLLYTGADPRTNEPRPPCVPLGELLDTLVTLTGDTGGDDREQARRGFVTRHPLQPFDPRNFVAGELGVARPFSFDPAALAGARRALGPRSEPEAVRDLRLPPLPTSEGDLPLDHLVAFVEHPVKAFLRQRLGVAVAGAGPAPVEDGLCAELEPLQRWAVADRLLQARLAGATATAAAAAERARGLLPPGPAGDDVLLERVALVEPIVAAYLDAALPGPAAVDVDAALGGRCVVGTVGGVQGTTVVRVTVSTLAARHRLRAWVQVLALTVSRPDLDWRGLVVGRGPRGAVGQYRVGPVGAQQAHDALAALVDLYERGMSMPLPLAPAAAEAYARRRAAGSSPHVAVTQARQVWTSGEREHGEAGDDAHALVWGRDAPFEVLLTADVPGLGEHAEGHAFGALSRLLWDGLLAAEAGPS